MSKKSSNFAAQNVLNEKKQTEKTNRKSKSKITNK